MKSATRILKKPRSTINALTRQIDIQTSQPLRTIAERRCLLNALQKFGEVATFMPEDNDNSKVLAIYETPEAASKAVDASPLTFRILSHVHSPTLARADSWAHGHGHEHAVNASINRDTAITIIEHEGRIRKNPWNNSHTGYSWDRNDHAIKNDTRIADIIAVGAPRGVFADGVIDVSHLRSGQEGIMTSKRMNGRMNTTVELKGSLLALLE